MPKKIALPECAEVQVFDCEGWPTSVLFGANDKTLIAAENASPRVYERESGKRLADFVRTPDAHGRPFWMMRRAGPKHFAGSENSHLAIWNADGSKIVKMYDSWEAKSNDVMVGDICQFAMSADRETIVYGDTDSKSLVCSPISRKKCHWAIQGKTSFASRIAITPDAKHCLTGGYDKSVRLWDMRNGSEVHRIGNHQGYVQAVQIFSEGALAATAGRDRVVRVWDIFKARELFQLEGHAKEIRAMSMTRDERLLITVGGDGARVWDSERRTCVATFKGHGKSIACVDISADNRFAVTAGHDSRLRVWELP